MKRMTIVSHLIAARGTPSTIEGKKLDGDPNLWPLHACFNFWKRATSCNEKFKIF